MTPLSRLLMALGVLGGISLAPCAFAQASKPTASAPPTAILGATAEPEVLPGLPRPPDAPRSLLEAPAPTPPYSCAPLPGPYFEPDPRLDLPPLPQPGWFTNAEVAIVRPHIKNRLTDVVQIGNLPPDTVHLPSAELDWTASP